MKLFSLFRKPAWEHSDPARRADAVSNGTDAALLDKLPDLARHDADASVRRAALARVEDLSLLADRARLDTDAQVRGFAEKRLRQHLVDGKVDVSQRQRQIRVLEDNDLLEHVASSAPESSLREEALARIQRKGFLIERCTKDADPALRLLLLGRIDDPTVLDRIAETARKSDKNLAREARQKAQAARLASGDARAIAKRAEEICDRLQHLVSHRPDDARAQLAVAESEFTGLNPAPPAIWLGKFQGLVQTLRDELDGIVPPPREAAAAPVIEPAPAPAQVVATPEPTIDPARFDERLARHLEQAHELAAAARIDGWRGRLESIVKSVGVLSVHETAEIERARITVDATAARLKAEADQVATRSRKIEERFDAASKAADAGEAQAALNAFAEAEKALAELGGAADRGLLATKKRVEQQLAKIRHWQRWSNNEQRVRWCETLEQLPEQALHPDALLTRIREAQAAMAKLDELEGLSKEEAQANGLNRRFRALVSRAIAPAKPYLNQRAEKRQRGAQQLRDQLAAIETTLATADTMPALIAAQRQLRELLDGTRDLEGRERKTIGDAIKAVLDPLKARLDAKSAEGEGAKRKLIAGLRRELVGADGETGRRLALDAQEQWKTLPRLKRAMDDQLWTELRSLIDPVFEKLRDARLEETARSDEQRSSARSAVESLRAAAAKLDADPHAAIEHEVTEARAKLDALDDRAEEPSGNDKARGARRSGGDHRSESGRGDANRRGDSGRRDSGRGDAGRGGSERGDFGPPSIAREFDRDYRAALKGLDEARARARLATEHQARLRQKALAELIAGPHESSDRDTLWTALSADLDAKSRAAWQTRLADTGVDAADELDALSDLAIEAELLAGIEAPEADKARRRELSMARLAERMGQGESADKRAEAIVLWQTWCLSPAFGLGRDGLNARIEKALGSLLGARA